MLTKIHKEMMAAMKARDRNRKDTLSALFGAIKKAAIDSGCKDNITDEFCATVILKEKKTVQEQIDTCPADRTDLLNQYKARMEIIDEFAPKLITDETEIRNLIENSNIETTKQNRGKIMGMLKGKVDMKIANKVLSGMM